MPSESGSVLPVSDGARDGRFRLCVCEDDAPLHRHRYPPQFMLLLASSRLSGVIILSSLNRYLAKYKDLMKLVDAGIVPTVFADEVQTR
ncbi:unnamed protein product [Cyprideis torosa]|uniref:Uncharacterized protein n=1 Tax=Cyprideis torosa TaxID=163714 RepID=A0A7R8WCW1_9CRUS|nr:unnamed protein product [Cyprideis torosa]CAG0893847.1 unnamed protein product [Cyprideis torosa]